MCLVLANYFQLSVPSESNDIPSGRKSTQALSRLEKAKRQLLQKNDWAAVGATRPAKIPFAPVDEVARFGKRRKLTHADYDRILSTGGTVARPVSNETRQRAPSELETIGHMNIRIRGPQTNTGCQNQHRESSQTMLLDEELIHASGKSQGLSRKETDSSCLLLSDDDLATFSLPCQSSVLSPGNDHPRLRKVDSPELHHPVPQLPRRFTIDDQLSAKLESSVTPSSLHKSIDPATCGRETSDFATGPAHGLDEARQSSSNCLPKPKHQIRRFIEKPRQCTPLATSLSDIVDDEYLTRPLRQYAPPTKLFGHTVITDPADDGYQNNLPFQYEMPSASMVSTEQMLCFSLDNGPNETGSTSTGVQDGPGPPSGPSFANISYSNINRPARDATSQQTFVISSPGGFYESFM